MAHLALLVKLPLNLSFTNVPQEPSDNGPLFSELKFYMRAAKPELSKCFIFLAPDSLDESKHTKEIQLCWLKKTWGLGAVLLRQQYCW